MAGLSSATESIRFKRVFFLFFLCSSLGSVVSGSVLFSRCSLSAQTDDINAGRRDLSIAVEATPTRPSRAAPAKSSSPPLFAFQSRFFFFFSRHPESAKKRKGRPNAFPLETTSAAPFAGRSSDSASGR